ncbi:hypothetical protein GOBAR_AA05323 [Gossypium barbadense]|uniref:Pre-rRNA-processing protein TSR2 homolog n=1 Tax=Gossypium barbadense TaxID=3634 RepID=A0A2P5YI62_GOSBA|nr:hypothetical protein GOBAR_AA05323 [Gossypium barbadense]
MESKKLTAESAPVFQEGISLILTRWSALTAAVENEWGGRDSLGKANAICTDVFAFFTEARAEPLYIDDLENLLEEGLLSLNTLVEDGSVEEVAEKLMIMHEECLEGNYQSVEKLRTTNPPPVAHVRPVFSCLNPLMPINIYVDMLGKSHCSYEKDFFSGLRDIAANMMVDVPNSQSSLNPVSMLTEEPKQNHSAEAEDGWVVVSSRKNKGRRN